MVVAALSGTERAYGDRSMTQRKRSPLPTCWSAPGCAVPWFRVSRLGVMIQGLGLGFRLGGWGLGVRDCAC
eukprot:1557460-Rhodomonas_salina.2